MTDRNIVTAVSFLVTVSYLGFGFYIEHSISGDASLVLISVIMGVLTSAFWAVMHYWLGSSADNRSKDAVIAGQIPQAPVLPTPSSPISVPPPPSLPPTPLPPQVPPAPKTIPEPPPPTPTAVNVLTLTGTMSTFGGPNDTGVKPDEGLALCEPHEIGLFPGLFLAEQPPGTTGLARRLDPTALYIACRWNYKQTPRSWLQTHKVRCSAGSIIVEGVQPIDWGPAESTGRVADLSPALETALGLTTGGTVTVEIPLPSASTAAPASAATGGLTKHIWPLQTEIHTGSAAFYGDPDSSGWEAANLVEVPCPWPLQIDGQTVHTIRIHSKCADSLREVLEAIWEACGKDLSKISALKYNRFDGSFVNRPMRESTEKSMHAYGCALDFDAADNPFHSMTHLFSVDSIIVQQFEAAGWMWGGRWQSPDAMHMQAARVHP